MGKDLVIFPQAVTKKQDTRNNNAMIVEIVDLNDRKIGQMLLSDLIPYAQLLTVAGMSTISVLVQNVFIIHFIFS